MKGGGARARAGGLGGALERGGGGVEERGGHRDCASGWEETGGGVASFASGGVGSDETAERRAAGGRLQGGEAGRVGENGVRVLWGFLGAFGQFWWVVGVRL